MYFWRYLFDDVYHLHDQLIKSKKCFNIGDRVDKLSDNFKFMTIKHPNINSLDALKKARDEHEQLQENLILIDGYLFASKNISINDQLIYKIPFIHYLYHWFHHEIHIDNLNVINDKLDKIPIIKIMMEDKLFSYFYPKLYLIIITQNFNVGIRT
jgi:hypothetical protein